MSSRRLVALALAAAATAACNTAPEGPGITLEPAEPTTVDELVATISPATDAEDDPLTYTVTWFRDGEEVPELGVQDVGAERLTSASPGMTAKGQVWRVEVVASDGQESSDVGSAEVTVRNTPPTLNAARLPLDPVQEGESLTCSAVGFTDLDGDEAQYAYSWLVDDAPVDGATTDTLTSDAFDKGQSVRCQVVPSDGEVEGEAVTSNAVDVLNTPPEATEVTVSPADPDTTTELVCSATGVDVDPADTVTFTYLWTVNGTVDTRVDGDTFPADRHVRGDQVACSVLPDDGEEAGAEVVSAPVTIANTPPVVDEVTLTPTEEVLTNTTLRASATGSDLDGDPIEASFVWFVNGVEVARDTDLLAGRDAFSKGDVVSVEATVTDGVAESEPLASGEVTVDNSPPSSPRVALIDTSFVPAGEDDLVCTIVDDATDPDEDPITYTLTWYVDGTAWTGTTSTTNETGDTLPADEQVDFTDVSCEAVANDGEVDGDAGTSQTLLFRPWVPVRSADVELYGAATSDNLGGPATFFGDGVAVGDLTGDGVDDLVASAVYADDGGSSSGTVYVFEGDLASGSSSASTADITLEGDGTFDYFGSTVKIGDLDGDGENDLLAGEYGEGSYNGAVHVFLGPLSSSLTEVADADFVLGQGENGSDYFGRAFDVGDLNDDGELDVVVGAYGYDLRVGSSTTFGVGRTYVFFGPIDEDLDPTDADWTLTGSTAYDDFGATVAVLGDLDGDDQPEWASGGDGYDAGSLSSAGAVAIFFGDDGSGDAGPSGADALLTGSQTFEYVGAYDIASGDVDDDGYADVVVGGYGYDDGSVSTAGRIAVFLGGATFGGTLSVGSDADATLVGENASEGVGRRFLVGDGDLDGVDDLFAGLRFDQPANDAGAIYAISGSELSGAVDPADATYTVVGANGSDYLDNPHALGDLDDDGLPDVVFGASNADTGGSNTGSLYVFFGKNF